MKCDLYVGRRCVDGTCPNIILYEHGEDVIPCSKCDLSKPSCGLCYWVCPDGTCDTSELRKYLEERSQYEVLLDTPSNK